MLKIYADYKEKSWKKNKKLKAFVTYKSIDKLNGGSGAIIKTINSITVPALKMEMGSGATFTGEIKVTDLNVDISSGAVTKIIGGTSTEFKLLKTQSEQLSKASFFTPRQIQEAEAMLVTAGMTTEQVKKLSRLISSLGTGLEK